MDTNTRLLRYFAADGVIVHEQHVLDAGLG